jgi:hypothetical protein
LEEPFDFTAEEPGIEASDIVAPAFPPNLFMNFNLGTAYYVGINPRNANAGTPAAGATVDNGDNRVEAVTFSTPGVYLVVCNVSPHFNDGMYAYVKISKRVLFQDQRTHLIPHR